MPPKGPKPVEILDHPPWTVWMDSLVNTALWGGVPLPPPKGTAKSTAKGTPQEQPLSYEDPAGHVQLPIGFTDYEWERATTKHPGITFTITPEENLDLISKNSHLLCHELMVHIINGILCLDKISKTEPFELDNPNPEDHVPNGGPEWKPWHHVYALTKAGKGQSHKPQYNKFGMYYVRLFYMGLWRLIRVDDFFPFDSNGKMLLPQSSDTSNLWLPILTKALLKIASLSWTQRSQLVDFDVISCLTSWTCVQCNSKNSQEEEMWQFLLTSLMKPSDESKVDEKCCVEGDASGSCINEPLFTHRPRPPRKLLLFMIDETFESEIPKISPNIRHLTLVLDAYADIFTIKDLPAWKKERWIEWAAATGKISSVPGTETRMVSMLCPFMKTQVHSMTSSQEELNKVHKVSFEKSVELEGSLQKRREPVTMKFTDLFMYISKIVIYYKASSFENKISTTNLDVWATTTSGETKAKGKGDGGKSYLNKGGRTESPGNFYLFSDSTFCKNFLITASSLSESKDEPEGSIIIEMFNWSLSVFGEVVCSFQTRGTRTAPLALGPGFQVLRIWYDLQPNHFVQIQSKTFFVVGAREYIHDMTREESASFMLYGEAISNLFAQILESEYGSFAHGELCCNYFDSFKYPLLEREPDFTKLLPLESALQDLVEEAIVEYTAGAHPAPEKAGEALVCIQNYLLQPEMAGLYLEYEWPEVYEVMRGLKKNNEEKEEKEWLEACKALETESVELEGQEKKAVSGKGTAKGKDANKGKETAKDKGTAKNGAEAGSKKGVAKTANKQAPKESGLLLDSPFHTIEILRLLMKKGRGLLKKYPFQFDDILKLSYIEYKGSVKLQTQQDWIPILRLILNIHSNEPTPTRIEVSCPVKTAVRILDLETKLDVPLSPEGVCQFKRSQLGICVLAYCLLRDVKEKLGEEVGWRMRVIGPRQKDLLHECTNPPPQCTLAPRPFLPLRIQDISGVYYPNHELLVCKFTIKIYEEDEVVTLYVRSSCPNARLSLTFLDEEIEPVIAYGKIFIPALHLPVPKDVEGLSEVVYTGKVEVLDQSWGLMTSDLLKIYHLKEIPCIQYAPLKSRQSLDSKQTKPKESVDLTIVPSWQITMVTQGGRAFETLLSTDTRAYDSFIEQIRMPAVEDEEDTIRLERGFQLREVYKASNLKASVADLMSNGRSTNVVQPLSEALPLTEVSEGKSYPVMSQSDRRKSSLKKKSGSLGRKRRSSSSMKGRKESTGHSLTSTSSVNDEPVNYDDLRPLRTLSLLAKHQESSSLSLTHKRSQVDTGEAHQPTQLTRKIKSLSNRIWEQKNLNEQLELKAHLIKTEADSVMSSDKEMRAAYLEKAKKEEEMKSKMASTKDKKRKKK